MEAKEIIDRSLALLGYENSEILVKRALSAVNIIYSDLFYLSNERGFIAVKSLNDEINLEEMTLNDVMPYGVAALIAQSENDGDNQNLYMSMYKDKRRKIGARGQIVDCVPIPEM